MDLVRLRVPYKFIRQRVRMDWPDIWFGLREELLDPAAPIEFAEERLATDEPTSPAVVKLAIATTNADIREYVEQLASSDQRAPAEETLAKWLFVTLAWVFENKHDYADPLGMVEAIYADFSYPERIASFVRYMPSMGPDLGSDEPADVWLIGKWKSYLDECARQYSSDPPMVGGGE